MKIDYRDPRHAELPHVVKFSGGRSSGMLLFTLLKSGQLDASRGDVVIFNNTAAEHPETYRFVNECRRRVRPTRVPFFQIEFQTYEDAHRGEWTRRPTYRLVNARPRTAANEDGFHWRGEVYEELLSWSGYVPNQFRRTCTKHLKLEPTRRFVQDWTTGTPGIDRLGHHHDRPRVDPAARFRIHQEHNGRVPEAIYLRKHAYCWSRPHVRPQQRYADFSPDWKPWRTKQTGLPEKQEHVTIIGLRGDEGRRIARVRNRGGHDTEHAGKNIYMPLDDWDIAQKDVNAFWEKRSGTSTSRQKPAFRTACTASSKAEAPSPRSTTGCRSTRKRASPASGSSPEHRPTSPGGAVWRTTTAATSSPKTARRASESSESASSGRGP